MATYSHNAGCITPVMTANDAPSPFVVSASNQTSPSNMAHEAFDQLGAANQPWYFNSAAAPQWLEVDLGAGYVGRITSYTLTASNNNASFPGMPTAWLIEGSNGSGNWTQLDSQTGITGWGNDEMRTYTISLSSGYRYYRLYMTEKEAGGAGWQLQEWELIGIRALAAKCYLSSRRDRLDMRAVSSRNQLA